MENPSATPPIHPIPSNIPYEGDPLFKAMMGGDSTRGEVGTHTSNHPKSAHNFDESQSSDEILKQKLREEEDRYKSQFKGTDTSTLLGQDSFEFEGHIYKVGPVSYDIEAQFEQRCYRNEIQGIQQDRPFLDNETYSHLINAYLNRRSTKFWAWKGLSCMEARSTEEGLKDLFYFVLYYYNNPMTNPLAEHPPVKRSLLDKVWDNHGKWMELKGKIENLTDPNPKAPTPPEKS